MSSKSRTITDHEEIKKWAEDRNATPSCVLGTGGKIDTGVLRLDFPGYTGEDSLQAISWDEWFNKFDDNDLALLVQDEMASGKKSNFNKIVSRNESEDKHSR